MPTHILVLPRQLSFKIRHELGIRLERILQLARMERNAIDKVMVKSLLAMRIFADRRVVGDADNQPSAELMAIEL